MSRCGGSSAWHARRMSELVKVPPGPRFAVVQTFRYLRDAYGYLIACQRRYGDTYLVPSLNGPLVMVCAPPEVQQVFTADPDSYVPFGLDAFTPLLGERSLLALSGQAHRRERKLLTPPFHGARMRAYGGMIRQAAMAAMAAWRPGEAFVMQKSTQWISLEVILRAVFGVQDDARVEEFRGAIIDMVQSAVPSLMFFKFMRRSWGGLGPYNRFVRAMARMEALIYAEIAARRGRPEVVGEDILSLMLAARHEDGTGMSDLELRDELLTLLFAGHETTGVALSWACYWLHRHPAALERLRADVDVLGDDPDPEALAKLPYLEAVCSETLRLHPIVPDIPRTLVKPLTIGGYPLAPPMGVAVATTVLHRREDLYPEPDRFRPERFLERRFTAFEYTPFGGGHRRCIGAAFATYELKLVLATFLRHAHLELAEPGDVKPARRNLVLGPDTGVRMVLRERRGVPARAA
jgi:cytochrome P450 family 110